MKTLILALAFALSGGAGALAASADFTDLSDGFLASPLTRLSGPDQMTFSAANGFFPFSGVLYTNADLDKITIDFVTPAASVEVVGGLDVPPPDGPGWIDGEITISGGGFMETYTVSANGPVPMTFAPGAPLSSIMIEVESFPNFSTAYLGLTSVTATPVPLPAPAAMLLGALALAGVVARRRSA
jgi:hypothetical protein